MYPNNPMLNQQMAQLDQEYAQKKANIMQNFYSQPQQNIWGNQSAPSQAQPASNQNVNWIQVSGVEGAKNQIVQQGCTAWMMDNNQPYFYVKSVDNVGSSTFRIFQFIEVQDVASEQAKTQIDPSQYVQRPEFDELKAQIEQLSNTQKKQPVKANKGAEDNG